MHYEKLTVWALSNLGHHDTGRVLAKQSRSICVWCKSKTCRIVRGGQDRVNIKLLQATTAPDLLDTSSSASSVGRVKTTALELVCAVAQISTLQARVFEKRLTLGQLLGDTVATVGRDQAGHGRQTKDGRRKDKHIDLITSRTWQWEGALKILERLDQSGRSSPFFIYLSNSPYVARFQPQPCSLFTLSSLYKQNPDKA